MKNIIHIWLCVGILNSNTLNISIADGISLYIQWQKEFEEIAEEYHCDSRLVAPIGLPEVLRFSTWQNYLENLALHHSYIKKGSKFADFSVGHFQMKPSFIESLECEILSYDNTSILFSGLIPEGDWTENKKRKFRLDNLKKTEMQFRYLCAYFSVMENRHADKTFRNKKEKLKFYAAAYNYGFTRPYSKIKNWQKIKAFPYGTTFNFEQDAYSDISWLIYQSIEEDTCKTNP